MTHGPNEGAVQPEGFTAPLEVYSVDPSRVRGARITMACLILVAVVFVALGAGLLANPEQVNKPVLAALVGGFAALWLGLAAWIFRRLARFERQRVHLHAEGIVVWVDDVPTPVRWARVRAFDFRHKLITKGNLERWAYVGREWEYRLTTDDGREVVVNAMLAGIEDLGSRMEHHLRAERDRSGSGAAGLEPPPADISRGTRTMIGLGLLGAAGLVLVFNAGSVFQAFTGPRPLTEQDLARATTAGAWDDYVSYTAPSRAVDTGLRSGRKNDPGTKWVLLPAGDRFVLCSTRIHDGGPTYLGRLEPRDGGEEEAEAIRRAGAAVPGVGQRLAPVMLQAVRSIWVDAGLALAGVSLLSLLGLWTLFRPENAAVREPATPYGSPPTGGVSAVEPVAAPDRRAD